MNKNTVTITGVLVPDRWKNNGEISGLALQTNDENKYVVNCRDLENDIMPMLRKKIEVSGVLHTTLQERIILVSGFRPASSVQHHDLLEELV